jgi:hypothetical protein
LRAEKQLRSGNARNDQNERENNVFLTARHKNVLKLFLLLLTNFLELGKFFV